MKTQINKTRFNLSTIMRRAHELYKNRFVMSETFGDCLRRAWSMAKAYARNGKISLIYGVEYVNTVSSVTLSDPIAAYYNNACPGQYFGD